MVFNVAYYSQLCNTIPFYLLPSEDVDDPQCQNNQFEPLGLRSDFGLMLADLVVLLQCDI